MSSVDHPQGEHEAAIVHSALSRFSDALMIFQSTPDGKVSLVQANPKAFILVGFAPNEIPLSRLMERFLENASGIFMSAVRQLPASGSQLIEIDMKRKDGSELLVEVSLDLVPFADTTNILAVARDVTSRKRIENGFRESEARYRLMFDKAPVGIMLQDKERRLVECNAAFEEMAGADKEDLLDKPYHELVHPEDVDKDARLFDLLMSGRIDHYNVEKRFISRDGRTIYGSLHVSGIRDEVGRPKFALGMLSDITQRKRMEVEVLRTRDYYQSILDNMPTLMWRSNDQLMREYFNKAWLGFTGRTFNEEYGHGWMRGVHPDDLDRLMEAQERSFLTQENFEIEYRLLAFDNEYHWMVDMARPFYDTHGEFKGYVGSVHDNTRQRRMQEKYHAQQQKK